MMLRSPLQQWATQPSFLFGEALFIACAIAALVHARRHGRAHVFAWVAALVAGTANDVFFMALPLVDNFWQAQATIMLTPRLPLYIPCVYVCFMYIPTVTVWRLGLPPLAGAAATGLLAGLFYAPYDIVGAKFLWWTWHDTDLPISNRILGAPIGSTMWVITFVAAFARLVEHGRRRELARAGAFAAALAIVAVLCTPLMMVQLTVLQQLDGGIPGGIGLVTVVTIYGALVARGWRARASRELASDRLLRAMIVAHFVTLAAVMAIFDPATHVATGVHQTYGPCGVEVTDIAGLRRHEFVCADELDEPFDFRCVGGPPPEGAQWYTVCGTPHRRFAETMLALAALAGIGIGVFGRLLAGSRRNTPPFGTS
jgi:hypothetical protein